MLCANCLLALKGKCTTSEGFHKSKFVKNAEVSMAITIVNGAALCLEHFIDEWV